MKFTKKNENIINTIDSGINKIAIYLSHNTKFITISLIAAPIFILFFIGYYEIGQYAFHNKTFYGILNLFAALLFFPYILSILFCFAKLIVYINELFDKEKSTTSASVPNYVKADSSEETRKLKTLLFSIISMVLVIADVLYFISSISSKNYQHITSFFILVFYLNSYLLSYFIYEFAIKFWKYLIKTNASPIKVVYTALASFITLIGSILAALLTLKQLLH